MGLSVLFVAATIFTAWVLKRPDTPEPLDLESPSEYSGLGDPDRPVE
jgi:hypothetical protein